MVDYHRFQKQYEASFLRIWKSKLSEQDKKSLEQFLKDCKSEGMGFARLRKLAETLLRLGETLPCSFDKAKEQDLRNIVTTYEEGNYSFWTRHDVKVILKQYYKWLNKGQYPKKVRWINTTIPHKQKMQQIKDTDLITEEELAKKKDSYRDKEVQHKMIWLIFIWVYAAMIAMSFWESYVEGRNSWDKKKLGWKIYLTKKYCITGYHFYIFVVMWPLLLTLPFVIYGWNLKLFGILVSAYFSGLVLEDFMWYVVNPAIKFKEFYSTFSNYQPWLKINQRKIIPIGYIIGITISIISYIYGNNTHWASKKMV